MSMSCRATPHAPRSQGVMPTKTEFVGNMRHNYDSWFKTMQEQNTVLLENNPTMLSLLHAKSRFLVGVTRPKNLQGCVTRAAPSAARRGSVPRDGVAYQARRRRHLPAVTARSLHTLKAGSA
jgi:hypothetical protein